jgi:hypothetical protein
VLDLTSYLYKLSTSPKTLAQFQRNPRAAMTKAGLTPKQKKALLSGNAAHIRAALRIRFWGRGKAE